MINIFFTFEFVLTLITVYCHVRAVLGKMLFKLVPGERLVLGQFANLTVEFVALVLVDVVIEVFY